MRGHVRPETLTDRLARRATIRTLVVLAVLCVVFTLGIFPWRTAHLRDLSGIAAPILDVRFAYAPETVHAVASALDESGRRFYALSELTADLIFPLVYSSFFSLLLVRMIPRAFPGKPDWRHLALLPFAALAFDYGENVSLAIILLGFPGTMPIVPVASLFTSAKWIVGGTSILLIAITGLELAVDRLRATRSTGARWAIGPRASYTSRYSGRAKASSSRPRL